LQSLSSAKNLPRAADAVVVEAAVEVAAAVDAAGEVVQAVAVAMSLGACPGEAATTVKRASALTQLTDANGQGRVLMTRPSFSLVRREMKQRCERRLIDH
jgi:coenzyme F420-reducing hydrogenase gamma subunit